MRSFTHDNYAEFYYIEESLTLRAIMRKSISYILIFILGGLMLGCTLTTQKKELKPLNLLCDYLTM